MSTLTYIKEIIAVLGKGWKEQALESEVVKVTERKNDSIILLGVRFDKAEADAVIAMFPQIK